MDRKLLKKIWAEHGQKIITFFGFLLVSIIAFEAGFLSGQKWQNEPLIIEKPAISVQSETTPQNALEAQKLASGSPNTPEKDTEPPSDCAYVGSKNSNKYHLPTCRWAKNIKPENLVCFKSVEDAVAKNYLPDKNCIK